MTAADLDEVVALYDAFGSSNYDDLALFGPDVLEPIGQYVEAKRCLCTVADYRGSSESLVH